MDSSSDDDPITPDSIDEPHRSRSPALELAERSVAVVLGLLRRANALAGGVLIFAAVACFIGYLLGILALGGGLRVMWIVVGGLFVAWAVGSVLLAMWRLRAVRLGSDALVNEVFSLIDGDRRSERTVIETVESTEGADGASIVQLSRQFFSLRDVVNGHTSNFTQLSLALSSITALPGLMAIATLIAAGFLGLSVIFLLVLVF